MSCSVLLFNKITAIIQIHWSCFNFMQMQKTTFSWCFQAVLSVRDLPCLPSSEFVKCQFTKCRIPHSLSQHRLKVVQNRLRHNRNRYKKKNFNLPPFTLVNTDSIKHHHHWYFRSATDISEWMCIQNHNRSRVNHTSTQRAHYVPLPACMCTYIHTYIHSRMCSLLYNYLITLTQNSHTQTQNVISAHNSKMKKKVSMSIEHNTTK